MSTETEQRKPWTIESDRACDICCEVPLTGPVVAAPWHDADGLATDNPELMVYVNICEKCLDDARLTLEAHREASARELAEELPK